MRWELNTCFAISHDKVGATLNPGRQADLASSYKAQ
jgi:hypothetical protein